MELFRNSSLSPKQRAEDLLSRMSITEKVGQLNQRLYGFRIYERNGNEVSFTQELDEELHRWGGLGVLYGLYRADPWSGRTYDTGIPAQLAPRVYNQFQRKVIDASRFGIPSLISSECPHGHQALDGYLLPVSLAMGATYAPQLVREAFNVVGLQLASQGIDLALVSILDVLRDPRWGRSEECFSEDPLLCAVMASAVVAGCREYGVDVVAKHFCAQGETTGGINASPASIGIRELLEIHLPPAKAAVCAGAKGIMAAYNEIDGVPCHANPKLLRGILREEWGFDGVVMADGTAVDRLGQFCGSTVDSGAVALQSGVDISLWDEGFSQLEEAVNKRLVEETVVDEAVLRVLTLKFARGLFESPYLDEDVPILVFSVQEYPQSLELARQGAVLLKNKNNILPLCDKVRRIAVIGPAADDIYVQLGDYTPPVAPGHGTTLWQGLQEMATHGVILKRAFDCGIKGGTQADIDVAVSLATGSDAVILALGGSSSRFSGAKFDISGAAVHDGDVCMDCGEGIDSATLALPGMQQELAAAMFATGVPVVTVIIAGRPYAVPDIADGTDALIYAFYPGPWGGKALAEIIFGSINPSGRLPASLPRSVGQLPCCYNRKASGTGLQYCDLDNSPLYEFGFGLSYTSFSITSVQESVCEKPVSLTVSFDLENTGERSGYAVPMLYIRWLHGDVTPREMELKAFKKVWLESRRSQRVTLELDEQALSRYDKDMKFTPCTKSILLILNEGGTEHWRKEVTRNTGMLSANRRNSYESMMG